MIDVTAKSDSPLLDRKAVAELLGLTVWQVRQLEKAGLPVLRTGQRSVTYHREEVLRWWREGRRERPESPASTSMTELASVLTALLNSGELRFEVTIRPLSRVVTPARARTKR